MSQQRIRGIVDARPVATFFFFAYAVSWIGWFPVVIGMGEPIRTLSFIAGGFGPALAGAVVTWLDGESVRAWTRQIVRWRVAARWYLAAFLLPLLVVSLASVVIILLGTTVDPTVLSGRLSLVLGSYVFVALIGGGTRNRAGVGSLSLSARGTVRAGPGHAHSGCGLGVLAPPLVADPNAVYSFAWLAEEIPRIVLRVVNIVGFAFLLTWIYNGTESVLLALSLHAGINTANSTLVPLPIEAITGESFMTVLIAVDLAVWVVAIVLIVATRGQLGYDTTRDTAGRQEFR